MDISKQTDLNLYEFIKLKSRELNIDEVGICGIDQYEKIEKDHNKNFSPLREIFPECRIIISACLSYNYRWNNIDSSAEGYIARYTTANFYKELKNRLKLLAKEIMNNFFNDDDDKKLYRIFVNSNVNDKLCAYASGIGIFSKNNLIAVRDRGVKFVLGEILLSMNSDFNQDKNDIKDICGNCSLCIEACPTKALLPNKLKKSICLQYLTTKEKWPLKINDRSIIDLWGKRFYGCTECTDICPYNNNSILDQPADNFTGFIGTKFDLSEILKLKKEDYKIRFQNNQLSSGWVKEYILARNALFALYNSGKSDVIKRYLDNLKDFGWSKKEINYLKKICNLLLDK